MFLRRFILLVMAAYSAKAANYPTPLLDKFKSNDKERKLLFCRLNLDYPGLEEVKKEVDKKDFKEASKLLLKYFRNREIQYPKDNFLTPELAKSKPLSERDSKAAANGMKHIVVAQPAHKPFFSGKTIEWFKLPYPGYENKVQIHRMYWWPPMAKLYTKTGDEKIAREWMEQYLGWYKASPLYKKYAWRTLETGHRLYMFTDLFVYYLNSPNFTPDFMVKFLNDIHRHGSFVYKHGKNHGNWLLMESERSIYTGLFFPEFKDSEKWIARAVDKILPEIKKQVYADGMQNELSSGYHCLAIDMFHGALAHAERYGKTNKFPKEYNEIIKNMLYAKVKWTFPDWNVMRFGDAWACTRQDTMNFFKKRAKWFPDDKVFQWFATDGKEGRKPPFNSVEMPYSGFYILRSGWDKDDTCMILKCGPYGFGHDAANDNSFELYVKGRYFFPNPGCYTYGGNKKLNKNRGWMKSSRMQNTVTLNNRDNPKDGGKKILWKIGGNVEICVTENPASSGCKIRRSVFFVDKKFFVIVDQLSGKAKGKAALHYQLNEKWNPKITSNQKLLISDFKDGNNIALKLWASKNSKLKKTDSAVAYIYNNLIKRKGISLSCTKKQGETIEFVSVLYPIEGTQAPEIQIKSVKADDNEVRVALKTADKDYLLEYKIIE